MKDKLKYEPFQGRTMDRKGGGDEKKLCSYGKIL